MRNSSLEPFLALYPYSHLAKGGNDINIDSVLPFVCNPKIYGVNIACVEGIKPFEIGNVPVNDGENHPLDQKK